MSNIRYDPLIHSIILSMTSWGHRNEHRTIWHRTIWHKDNLTPCVKTDDLTLRIIWHHTKKVNLQSLEDTQVGYILQKYKNLIFGKIQDWNFIENQISLKCIYAKQSILKQKNNNKGFKTSARCTKSWQKRCKLWKEKLFYVHR